MIRVKNLSFVYKGATAKALKDIDLEVNSGEFLGITGTTGSGKTTLAYCLKGLIPHSIEGQYEGDVWIKDCAVRQKQLSQLAATVGLVFQNPDWQLFSSSVSEEIEFGVRNLGLPRPQQRVDRALRAVNLGDCHDKDPHDLSQGQKQKVCLASIIAMDPEVIVIDEATSQLDYKNTRGIYDVLQEINEEGKTIISIDHDTDVLAQYAHRLALMDQGEIIEKGPRREVVAKTDLLAGLGIKIPRELET